MFPFCNHLPICGKAMYVLCEQVIRHSLNLSVPLLQRRPQLYNYRINSLLKNASDIPPDSILPGHGTCTEINHQAFSYLSLSCGYSVLRQIEYTQSIKPLKHPCHVICFTSNGNYDNVNYFL